MSGATSLKGLVFQHRYTTYRVLVDIAEGTITANTDPPRIRGFSIEGLTTEDSPAWDIRLESANGDVDLNECKCKRAPGSEDRCLYQFQHKIESNLLEDTNSDNSINRSAFLSVYE